MTVRPRIRVPKTAMKGDVVEIKSLISHKMETGLRKDKKTGKPIPRNIIKEFVCNFDGRPIFRAEWFPAMAAHPYMAFEYRAEESGEFEFVWTEDTGKIYSKKTKIAVS